MNNILRPTLELTVIIPGMIQISLFYTFCNFLFANMLVQSQIQKTCHLLFLTNAWQYIKLATDSISCILWYKKCGLAPLFFRNLSTFLFSFPYIHLLYLMQSGIYFLYSTSNDPSSYP